MEGDFGLSGKTTDVRVAADEEAIMTLAMTVIAPWGICQCSDCRLTDKSTNPPTVTDDRSIKHVSVMVPDWVRPHHLHRGGAVIDLGRRMVMSELCHRNPEPPRRPVRVTALRRGDVFAFEPGPASRKHGPTPGALPPPRTTWAKWTTRVYFVPQSKWPLPRSASEPGDLRERGGNDGAVSEQSQWCGCLSLLD